MKAFTGPTLLRESRSVVYRILLGTWAQILIYCILHDQYLVRIAPEHFTVYHAPLWGLTHPPTLAAAWAFRASIGPGLILGLAALWTARAGSLPKLSPGRVLRRIPKYLALTEIAGLLTGALAWTLRRPIYPEIVYPDLDPRLLTTQTIQLTCYLVGALCGLALLIELHRLRRQTEPR